MITEHRQLITDYCFTRAYKSSALQALLQLQTRQCHELGSGFKAFGLSARVAPGLRLARSPLCTTFSSNTGHYKDIKAGNSYGVAVVCCVKCKRLLTLINARSTSHDDDRTHVALTDKLQLPMELLLLRPRERSDYFVTITFGDSNRNYWLHLRSDYLVIEYQVSVHHYRPVVCWLQPTYSTSSAVHSSPQLRRKFDPPWGPNLGITPDFENF